jgi:hypothetical protein
MKQLLKEIVKRITQNLLGKSVIESSSDQQIHDESHSVCLQLNFIIKFFFYSIKQ